MGLIDDFFDDEPTSVRPTEEPRLDGARDVQAASATSHTSSQGLSLREQVGLPPLPPARPAMQEVERTVLPPDAERASSSCSAACAPPSCTDVGGARHGSQHSAPLHIPSPDLDLESILNEHHARSLQSVGLGGRSSGAASRVRGQSGATVRGGGQAARAGRSAPPRNEAASSGGSQRDDRRSSGLPRRTDAGESAAFTHKANISSSTLGHGKNRSARSGDDVSRLEIDELVAADDVETGQLSDRSDHGQDEVHIEDEEADDIEGWFDDDDEASSAEEWPKLFSEPCAPHEPLVLGPRPRSTTDSIYSTPAVLNANVNQYLRPYQREGVEWLWRQYQDDRGGVLADEMGLGKTVQVSAFLSVLMGKTATSADKSRSFPLAESDCRQALIVVPTTTLANWERELSTWGWFKVRVMHGSKQRQEEAILAARERRCEVVLTSYGTLNKNTSEFASIAWEVTVWDEAHIMKNERTMTAQAARQVPCTRRMCLTGTPMSNRYKELWVLFDFVSDGRVGEAKDFEMYYSRALGNGLKRNAKQWEIQARISKQRQLKDLIDAWMIQRFKTIIADEMPKKFDNIVFCRLAAEQEEVYMRVIESADYQQLIKADDPCIHCNSGEPLKRCHQLDMEGVLSRWHHPDGEMCARCPFCVLLPAVTQLGKIANHLELIKPDDSMDEDLFQRQSDFARMAFGLPGVDSVTRDRTFWSQSHSSNCGKMQALKELLKVWKRQKAKVLIFSQSTQLLDILQDFVTREAYSFERLDGQTSARSRALRVRKFNDNESVFLFLLSTKAGGLGINLVAASKVVIFEPSWNPSYDMQAMDRAYRIGQRKDVQVYRFISSNTIEEKIYHRQLYKHAQEGLALHQRDETRYFEGVIGDEKQKGELFGVKNLLTFHKSEERDLRTSATAAIISSGRRGFDVGDDDMGGSAGATEEGDNFCIAHFGEVQDVGEDEAEEGGEEGDDYGAAGVLRSIGLDVANRNEARSTGTSASGMADTHGNASMADSRLEGGDELERTLRLSGAVHMHEHANVVGGALLSSLRAGKSTKRAVPKAPTEARRADVKPLHPPTKQDADSPAVTGQKRARPSNISAPAMSGKTGVAHQGSTPDVRTTPGTSTAASGPWPPTPPASIADCLSGCYTYSEFYKRLASDEVVAWRAKYAAEVWGKAAELAAAVLALPDHVDEPDTRPEKAPRSSPDIAAILEASTESEEES